MAEPLTLIRVVDVETTGMEIDAEVVEIGWTDVRFYPGSGWAIERGPFAQLCSVTVPIEPEARAEHHIADEDLVGMPAFLKFLPRVVEGADHLAAHNATFDSGFFPDKRMSWICTMKCAAALWPDYPSYKNQALRYRRGYVFEDPEKTLPAHRAGPDSYVTAHILIDLLSQTGADGASYPLDAFVKVSAQPRRMLRIMFGKHRGQLFSELPADYLDWIVNNSELDEDVKWNCRRELDRRRSS